MQQTRKVVINDCYGGFNLSLAATALYAERKGVPEDEVFTWDIPRDDYDLIAVVDTLGGAMGHGTKLKVVEIPADVRWIVEEYDGWEHVAEAHRTWR